MATLVIMACALPFLLARIFIPAPFKYYCLSSRSQPNYPFLREDLTDTLKFFRLHVLITLLIYSFKYPSQYNFRFLWAMHQSFSPSTDYNLKFLLTSVFRVPSMVHRYAKYVINVC